MRVLGNADQYVKVVHTTRARKLVANICATAKRVTEEIRKENAYHKKSVHRVRNYNCDILCEMPKAKKKMTKGYIWQIKQNNVYVISEFHHLLIIPKCTVFNYNLC